MKKLCVIYTLAFALFSLASCSKYETEGEPKYVVVIFSPNALGDGSYFDDILAGAVLFEKKNEEYKLRIITPESMAEGEMYFQRLIAEKSDKLILLAGSEYQSVTEKFAKELESKTCEVLLLESQYKGDLIKTRYLSMYGSSYLTGCMLAEEHKKVAVISANKFETSIDAARQGVVAGFTKHAKEGSKIENTYISDKAGGGFADTQCAYKLANELYKEYEVIFPLVGGSISGIMRSNLEIGNYSKFLVGMDIDMSNKGLAVKMSVVKRMDILFEKLLIQWGNGELTEQHVTFGLESEFVDVVVASGDKTTSALKDKFKAEAIKAEKKFIN